MSIYDASLQQGGASMSELYNDEFLNAFPTDVFPIAATIPERVSEEAPALVRRVGLGFIIAYAAAYYGSWIAIVTPVVVTLDLRIQQINPAGKAASLSLVLGVGAIFALLANPVFGKLSDRSRAEHPPGAHRLVPGPDG